MTRQLRRFFALMLAFLCCLFFGSIASAANTFSVTFTPSPLEVTMKDPYTVLPVTITNSAASALAINAVRITLPASYSLSMGTTAPAGWCVKNITAGAGGTVDFYFIDPTTADCGNVPTAGAQLPIGGSLTFSVMATPNTAVADLATDTLSAVSIIRPAGFTQTGTIPSPAWTRRSLDAVMTAAPSSVVSGGQITLNMQVSNKSSAGQTFITTTPAPPIATPAIATLGAGPFYASTALSAAITASSTSVTVAFTTDFPAAPSSIQIDSEKIWYTGKTATTFTGLTRGYGGTTAGSHSSGTAAYRLTAFSLTASGLAGDNGTITWKYTANSTGTVSFSARAIDSTNTAKSKSVTSNVVAIGDFTSLLSVSPNSAVSGQNVTVSMMVQNNDSIALVNVAPSALTAGAGCTATQTFVSGPSPASISSIAPGSSGIFTWTYTVTGAAGATYCWQGNATANGPVSSLTSTSSAGAINSYSAVVTPTSVPSGSINKTFTWTVYNKGACPLDRVEITIPTQSTCATTGWCYSTSAVTTPAVWTGSLRIGPPDKIRFRDNAKVVNIMPGGSGIFSITFSTTQTVTEDTYVSFPINFREAKTGVLPCTDGISNYSGGSQVVVTANSMTIASAPVGPVPADGNSAYTITATLKNGATPLTGKTVTFTTTNGTLSSATAITNASGIATVTLTAPYSTVATSATVTATYMNAQATTATLNFSAYLLANLAYWGGLSPSCGVPGSLSSYSLNVKNTSAVSMSLTSNSYFAYNDGANTYCAYLNSGSTGAVSAGAIKALTFGSPTTAGAGGGVTVPAGFTAGSYLPTSNTVLCPGVASGLYLYESAASKQNRNVTDYVTVGATCAGSSNTINIIEWYEMR